MHTYRGQCPDALQPDSRDPSCPACRDLGVRDRYHDALDEIRRNTLGKVCEDYALCDHESCRASYTAWAIADRALHDQGANP